MQDNNTSPYRNYTALVVDDYQAMNKTIANMLVSMGFKRVIRAMNGNEALQIIDNSEPDIIVSDWNMPKVSGIELLEKVRSKPGSIGRVPFIMLTGNVEQDDVRRAVKAGVSEYLIKPFNHNNLKKKIVSAFQTPIRQVSAPQAIAASELKPAEKEQDDTPQAKSSILVVDDKANNIAVLSELLKADYTIQASLTGKKAIQLCQREPQPDLILLDIMMPEMDGIEVCTRLKEDPTTEHIPIIFVTALSETENVVKGLELGAVDYITKPITPEITKARIATHLKIVEQRKSMSNQLENLIENLRFKEEIEKIIQHDLRGPLGAIMAANEELENKSAKQQPENDIIRDAAGVMLQMIEDQMLIYQLENNKKQFELEPINAFKAINEVLFGLKKKCKDLGVTVASHVTNEFNFMGESLLTRNMFHNIIANAIEAAPKQTKVDISCTKADDQVSFEIHNKGMIPAEIQSSFFEKFVTAGKQEGTGIGTYSAKLSAQAQGGNISFESDLASGTTLKIMLNAST